MWNIAASSARWQSPDIELELKLDQPQAGIRVRRIAGRPYDATIFQLENIPPDTSPSDHYVRQSDLIVSYDQSPTRNVSTQLYWRIGSDKSAGVIALVEMLLSVQSDALDGDPMTELKSCLKGNDAFVAARQAEELSFTPSTGTSAANDPAAVLIPGEELCYLEATHPADFVGQRVVKQADGLVTWKQTLFPQKLEKGVILRARIEGAFLESDHAIRVAQQKLTEFRSAAPPLTT